MTESHKAIDFEFRDDRGWLFVSRERSAFEQVLKEVQQQSKVSDISEIDAREVRELLIYDSSHHPKRDQASARWKDRLMLIGCGIVAFIVAFVFLMGIWAIFGLAKLPA